MPQRKAMMRRATDNNKRLRTIPEADAAVVVVVDLHVKEIEIIQRAWRRVFSLKTLKHHLKPMLLDETLSNPDKMRAFTKSERFDYMKQASVVEKFTKGGNKIMRTYCTKVDRTDKVPPFATTKLLAVYSIVYDTDPSFVCGDPMHRAREDDMLNSAKNVVDQLALMSKICQRKSTVMPLEMISIFVKHLKVYLQAFQVWEVADKRLKAEQYERKIMDQLMALRTGPDNEDDKNVLKQSILRLKMKISEMLGPDELALFEKRYYLNQKRYRRVVNVYTHREQLVHEIVLDPLFKMKEDGINPLLWRNCEEGKREEWLYIEKFMESIAKDIENKDFRRVVALMHDIRTALLEMTEKMNKPDETDKIKDLLKEEDIPSLFTAEKHKKVIGTVFDPYFKTLRRMQTEDNAKETLEEWVGLKTNILFNRKPYMFLSGSIYVLRKMIRVEVWRLRVDALRAESIVSGIASEKALFERQLRIGQTTTTKTMEWLKKAKEEFIKEETHTERVVVRGLVAILVTTLPPSPSPSMIAECVFDKDRLPETLFLDAERMEMMNAEFRSIVQCLVAFNMVFNYIKNKFTLDYALTYIGYVEWGSVLEIDKWFFCNAEQKGEIKKYIDEQGALFLFFHSMLKTTLFKFVVDEGPIMGNKRMITHQLAQNEHVLKLFQRQDDLFAKIKRLIHVHWLVHGARYHAALCASSE